MKKMNKKGFTLIEMLVVIAIIAILVAIVIPTVTNATQKAKQATDVANLRSYVAEYEIATVTGVDASAKLAKISGFTATASGNPYHWEETTKTATYTASMLDGGTGEGGHVYEWKLADVYSESNG